MHYKPLQAISFVSNTYSFSQWSSPLVFTLPFFSLLSIHAYSICLTRWKIFVCHYFLWTIAHVLWPCRRPVVLPLQHISIHIFWQARKNHGVHPPENTKDWGIKVTLLLIFINYCSRRLKGANVDVNRGLFLAETENSFLDSAMLPGVYLYVWFAFGEGKREEEVLCLKPREGFGSWEQRKYVG